MSEENKVSEDETRSEKEKLINDVFYKPKEVTYDEYKSLKQYERYKTSTEPGSYTYYKREKLDIAESDLPLLTQLKIYQKLDKMDKIQKAIKGIMIFWLVLTIIGIIGILYMCAKIGSVSSGV